MTDDSSAAPSAAPIERWTAKLRATLILSILKEETSVAEAAREATLLRLECVAAHRC